MPAHDWTRVDAGLFHDFHQTLSIQIKGALNDGLLPKGYYALVEQRVGGPEPDVIAVETCRGRKTKADRARGLAVADPPQTRVVKSAAETSYARRANRITV